MGTSQEIKNRAQLLIVVVGGTLLAAAGQSMSWRMGKAKRAESKPFLSVGRRAEEADWRVGFTSQPGARFSQSAWCAQRGNRPIGGALRTLSLCLVEGCSNDMGSVW